MLTDVSTCDFTQGYTDTVRESALKVGCGRKISCRTGNLNLRQRRAGQTDALSTELHPPPSEMNGKYASKRQLKKNMKKSKNFQSYDSAGFYVSPLLLVCYLRDVVGEIFRSSLSCPILRVTSIKLYEYQRPSFCSILLTSSMVTTNMAFTN